VKLFRNPNLFCLFRGEGCVVWDYGTHNQYELNKEYFDRLQLRGQNSEFCFSSIDEELLEANLLSRQEYEDKLWGWDQLAKIFHMGTSDLSLAESYNSNEEWAHLYLDHCEKVENDCGSLFVEREGEVTSLPAPDFSLYDDVTLLSVLKNRMTSRCFDGKKTPLNTLSTLLFSCFGLIHGPWSHLKELGLKELGIRKSSPSGGGLHPTEAYVLILNVEGITPGLYHYNVKTHSLTEIQKGTYGDKLVDFLVGQYFAKDLSFGVFLTAYFEKMWGKYPHSRAYRVALMDVGHLSQTFQLCATGLKLSTWLTGVFKDTEVSQFLKLEGIHQAPLFFVGAGTGDPSPLDPIMIEALKDRK
jgi:SagB-type dehydrogenase family enzyme